MYRAKKHFDELREELVAYYDSDPGGLVETEESTPEHRKFVFREKKPVPARLALICGDGLQCLRSSLDYMVWELVESAGKQPHRRLMFPIAMSEATYMDDLVKRKRLDGVDPNAIALIGSFQPYHLPDPKNSVLGIFEELTNINKHRRVILTRLLSSEGEYPLPFPHILGVVKNVTLDGEILAETSLRGFICINDGFARDIEITDCLDTIARFIGEEMLPCFEKYFE